MFAPAIATAMVTVLASISLIRIKIRKVFRLGSAIGQSKRDVTVHVKVDVRLKMSH